MKKKKKIGIVLVMILTCTVCLIITNNRSSSNSKGERASQGREAGKSLGGEVDKSGERDLEVGEVGKEEVVARHGEVYIMGLRYMGQQAAGIKCLSDLQCWAGGLGLPTKIVEPVLKHTEIEYSLTKANSTEFMELGDYFDMQHLNAMSKSIGYAQIIPRGEYFQKASKEVIFIRSNVKGTSEELEWTNSDADPCYIDKDGAVLNRKLSRELRESRYCVIHVVVVKAGQLTHQTMAEILGKWRHRSVTVMISRWGPPTVSLSSACKDSQRTAADHFHPSTRLLQDARRYYRNQDIDTTKYSAVMIRLEHAIMITERDDRYSIRGCLDKVVSSMQKLDAHVVPMVAADIGKYGSNTWKWAVKDQQKLGTAVNDTRDFIVKELLQYRLSFNEWEGTFVTAAGGVTNEGYIAALQRTIASRAKCLVLMGGGSFQEMVLKEYLNLHGESEWCVTLVCSHYKAKMKAMIEQARKVGK